TLIFWLVNLLTLMRVTFLQDGPKIRIESLVGLCVLVTFLYFGINGKDKKIAAYYGEKRNRSQKTDGIIGAMGIVTGTITFLVLMMLQKKMHIINLAFHYFDNRQTKGCIPVNLSTINGQLIQNHIIY
ncbi:MAG: hypothetical protein JWO06_4026, partial [Bacteroidota bacterium]|nr:hypothetical protein [Bacteroidota bacterium]